MSGTSLDGLDIACCEFIKKEKWEYKITDAETIPYNKEWKEKLSSVFAKVKQQISILNVEYGKYLGEKIKMFIKRRNISPDFISSHGHTVFHQPEKGITLQIGDGKTISSVCNLPVVCDFRSGDVALGGQGAPLVPIVDKLLFSEYDFCLNLGGIANISYDDKKKTRRAFDICPSNMVLNSLATQLGKDFDRDGRVASKGNLNIKLMKKLNELSFYKIKPPKSLGREWIEKNFFPILDLFNISIQDKLRTVVEHIAIQIALAVNRQLQNANCKLFITGGGAYNNFLVERIATHTKYRIILPDDQTIQFKEAMAFAFLGVLKIRGEKNILRSVTGAKYDSCGGKVFGKIKSCSHP